MEGLEDAMAELEQARSDVSHTDVRTQIESVTASLQEMLDTAAGERTDSDVAFGDTDFPGAAPCDDNLRELEETLAKLIDNVDQGSVEARLESARREIGAVRTRNADE